MLAAMAGPESAFLDGAGEMSGMLVLMHRAMSIAGGTSEIKRNQIGETDPRPTKRPADPLAGEVAASPCCPGVDPVGRGGGLT